MFQVVSSTEKGRQNVIDYCDEKEFFSLIKYMLKLLGIIHFILIVMEMAVMENNSPYNRKFSFSE